MSEQINRAEGTSAPFTNPDTFISDLMQLSNTVPDTQAIPLVGAAMMLAKAGQVMEVIRMLSHDVPTMAANLAPLMIDISDDLTNAWLSYGKIEEKVWAHKSEQEVAGSISAIIAEEALEVVQAVAEPAHYEAQFKELIDELMLRIKAMKTGAGVEVNYTLLRDAITDTRVTLGNFTTYYSDIPQGEDLCEVIRSNMSKIPDDNGFIVDSNLKITKPLEFSEANLRPWTPNRKTQGDKQ